MQPIEVDLNTVLKVMNETGAWPLFVVAMIGGPLIMIAVRIFRVLSKAMSQGLTPEEMRTIEQERAKREEEPAKEFYIGHGYVMTDDGEIKPMDLFK